MTAHVTLSRAASGDVDVFEPMTFAVGGRTERARVADALGSVGLQSERGHALTMALVQRVAGDERQFVNLMNDTASTLGMAATAYAAATPEPRALTTSANDIALLAKAMIDAFPDAAPRAAVSSAFCPGAAEDVGRADGDDRICLTASTDENERAHMAAFAVREGAAIIIVIFNAPTPAVRDAHAENLAAEAWAVLDDRARAQPVRVAAALSSDRSAAEASGLRASATPGDREGTHVIQVGAFRSREDAEARLAALADLGVGDLTLARSHVFQVGAGGASWRARFVDLSRDAARQACAALLELGEACVVVAQTHEPSSPGGSDELAGGRTAG